MAETKGNACDSSKVTASQPKVGGSIFRAPVGTILPIDTTTPLNEAFLSLGYISEDGIVNGNSPSSSDVKAWGGDVVLSSQTDKPDTFKFKLIEALNVNVLRSVYGEENVTGDLTTEIAIKANSKEQKEYSYVVEMILKGGVLKRIVIPSAKVTAVADVTYNTTSAIGYETTLSAHPDESGNTHYEYIKKQED